MPERNARRRRGRENENNSENEVTERHLQERPANSSLIISILITSIIFIAVCAYGHNNSPINAVEIENVVEVELEGPFAVNEKLSHGKRIAMRAPESCAEADDKKLYVGLRDGRVVCIHPSNDGEIGAGKVENITTGVIEGAVNTSDAWGHGVPLGIRLRGQSLYVMDAIYGFYVIDLPTKSLKILIEPDVVTPPMKFPNDFDISADEKTVYFTDSSEKYPITELMSEVLEGSCTSRLIKYDMLTQKLDVVKDGLCFGNGVQLIDDESMVIVPETTRYRVNWIDTKTWEIKHFLHLPAMPDNVRRNRRGNYWIGGTSKMSNFVSIIFRFPSLRQILIGLFPSSILLKAADHKHCMLFEVDNAGEVIQTLHDPDGSLAHALSQGTELSDGRIALGTYSAQFLAIADIDW
nr:adipocyte plasma membrane-associated protein [Ciona intestinalis]|eukprot:XP_002126499.1 adipocyte plasma membrane-associated protein [Ciona intestinalis]